MQYSSRREFLKGAGAATIGVVALSGLAGGVLSCTKPSTTETKPPAAGTSPTSTGVPWPYQKIDPVAAAERAYAAYSAGGCMYGGFEGIFGELRNKIGSPYDTFPVAMMKYGSAGVSGWGTLCGSLNGAAAAICLVSDPKVYNSIINELFGWYAMTELPDFKPAKPTTTSQIDTTVANSPLCHISVSKWCTKTGFKTSSPQRADRCGRLTASVVRYAVDLLNKQAAGTFKAAFKVTPPVAECLTCHGKGSPMEDVHVSNQSQCIECHTSLPSSHDAFMK
jgi:hypothetical protein